ncbi:TetR/AcrR family transcriptional regulator [Caballeronia grimmiae]|uniref:TetR/AcrR family transcriptional regulator n=1 Tax=Caballeronia grimmiae TaxID=1071679 RepID=UPI0038B753DF
MARPREFDEDAVLDAATVQFWSRGYEATSVRDLAAAMGLTSASLYNAFGDKRALYERALERYVERGFRERVQRLEHQAAPRDAIVMFFDEIIRLSVNDPHRKGCLIVNAAMELAPHDKQFQRALNRMLKDIEGFFARCVTAGQEDGAISLDIDAADIAKSLLASLIGLRVLARVNPKRELLEGALRPVLAMLDATPKATHATRARRKS